MRPLAACLLATVALSVAGTLARADTAMSPQRVITTPVDGVFVIRHVDPFPGYVNGNTTVIVGSRDVLVVDSTRMSTAAQEDIAQIRKWTDKPVRWLVNTHWHWDHNAGNADYRAAFPGVGIVAHRETRDVLELTRGQFVADIGKSIGEAEKKAKEALASGKGETGKPLSDRGRKYAEQQVHDAPLMREEARIYHLELPDVTFEDELRLDLGGREVVVRHPGRGNTGGDVVAYLPKEKLLVAGDLVVHPVPYTFDGYPRDWVATLDALLGMDLDTLVPGHGDVLHGKEYLSQTRDLVAAVVEQVGKQVGADSEVTLDEVKKHVDVTAMRGPMLGDDSADAPFWDYAVSSLVELAYHEAKAR